MTITPALGLGVAPLGVSIYGYGQPASLNALTGNLLEDPILPNTTYDAPFIDPTTGDYVIDSKGQVQGQSSIAQQVWLALATTLGSSSISGLGSDLKKIKVMDSTYKNKVRDIVNTALTTLTQTGKINLISIDFDPNVSKQGLIKFSVNWLDNTTNQNFKTVIQ